MQKQKAFTLIELLVVISIIALLCRQDWAMRHTRLKKEHNLASEDLVRRDGAPGHGL